MLPGGVNYAAPRRASEKVGSHPVTTDSKHCGRVADTSKQQSTKGHHLREFERRVVVPARHVTALRLLMRRLASHGNSHRRKSTSLVVGVMSASVRIEKIRSVQVCFRRTKCIDWQSERSPNSLPLLASVRGGDREQITEWASRHGVVVRFWYTDFANGTAPLRERPGLRAALSALKPGSVDLLLVASPDCLTRSLDQMTSLLHRLNATKVLLRSVRPE